jgi:hypothetical protein
VKIEIKNQIFFKFYFYICILSINPVGAEKLLRLNSALKDDYIAEVHHVS